MSCEKVQRSTSFVLIRCGRHALDTLICFCTSNRDFSSVSETEEKLKNAAGSLDRDLGVWDIEITRHALISLT
jgi:hypothetical protein